MGCLVEVPETSQQPAGLLLCRRAIEPAEGLWTLPAGYLELGESARAGAVRETWEEARAQVHVTAPFAEFDLVHIGQVYRLYHAAMERPGYDAGPESTDVRVFPLDRLPLDELAFPVIDFALRLYRQDREAGVRAVHLGSLTWSGQGSPWDAAQYNLHEHLSCELPS